MRLLHLLLLVIGLSGITASYAQTVTLKKKNASLQQVLVDIYGQTKYYFAGSSDLLKTAKRITIDVKNVPLRTALDICFKDQPVQYSLQNNIILIAERKLPSREASAIFAEADTIVKELDKVQIIGYGKVTRRLNTGNVASISAKTIAAQRTTNSLIALQGRVPGLFITQSNGLPGAGVNVQIRGRNSIGASNNPLYIVDGVPFTSTPIQIIGGPNGDGSSNYGSPMNLINPMDIASVDILKDADATAIYGSRAANGVVLISTKRADSNDLQVTVDINKGFGRVTKLVPMLNMQQYLQVRRDGLANAGLAINDANAPDFTLWDTTKYTDWQKWYMGRTTETTTGNVSVSGGNDLHKVLLSGSFHEESTVLPEQTKYRRANAHFNYGYNSKNKKFSFSANAFYTLDRNKLSGNVQGALWQILSTPPNYPIYDAAGKYYWHPDLTNYVADLRSFYRSKADNFNSNAVFQYSILENLKAKVSVGYNRISIDEIRATPSYAKRPSTDPPKGSSVFGKQFIETYIAEPQLEYSIKFNELKVELLAGGTVQKNLTKGRYSFVNNYEDDLSLEDPKGGVIIFQDSVGINYRYISAFGRARFNWKDKYVMNVNLRRDGSSRFGPGRQFGNFFSVAGAWLFSKESFIADNLSFLSFGKLRSSYGTVGNDGIADYGFLSTYSNVFNPYGNTIGLSPNQPANKDYRWELNRKFEAAIELGFLKDRLFMTLARYYNKSTDQLLQYQLPSMSGFLSYQANLPAVVVNKGWELDIHTVNIYSKKVKWTSQLNLTIPRNKLKSFPGIEGSSYANFFAEGYALDNVQLLLVRDFDPQTGMFSFVDINNDGVININQSSHNGQPGDKAIVGNLSPRWYGGFSNVVTWKKFEISALFNYVNQKGYNLNRYYHNVGYLRNIWEGMLNYWSPQNTNGTLPAAHAQFNQQKSYFSSSKSTIESSSFLRLRNLMIAYNLTVNNIKQLNVYLNAQNLITITRFNGYDPETSINPNLMVPPLKSITIGARLIF